LRILPAADPEEAGVEQPDGAGQHPLAGQAAAGEGLVQPAADVRQAPGQAEHAVELLPVAAGPPLLVVEVLPAAGRIGADRLDVAVRPGADPDIPPGGRDDQGGDPLAVRRCDGAALGVAVGKAPAAAVRPDAGAVRVAAPQPGHEPTCPLCEPGADRAGPD